MSRAVRVTYKLALLPHALKLPPMEAELTI
jgi:hypothetical protein